MSFGVTGELFRQMLREEFRMHSRLFGTRRFIAFPVFLALLVGLGIWLLAQTGTAIEMIVAGLFVLVLFLGLQVGTVGLVGRDAMRNVLGDMTLLVFSGRTLPLSQRQLLGVFLAKDLVYYVFLFLTPIAIGFLPLVVDGGFGLADVGLLWAAIAGTFALGAGGSLALIGLASRSRLAVIGFLVGLVAAALVFPETVIGLTPYGVYADPSLQTAFRSSLGVAAVVIAGPLMFEPPTRTRARRVDDGRYQQFHALGGALTARPMVEVTRSSGSGWKVVFSLGILFGVAALLLDRLAAGMNIQPSAGIAFGTLLGLGTFTTYNWVTQHDDEREYLRHPIALDAVFAGKRRAFFLLSIPTGFFYLALAGVLFTGTELLLGGIVFPLLGLYVFGVTAYMTGFSPNELLFDTPLFALYAVALMLVALPLLVAALAFDEWPLAAAAVAAVVSVLGAVVGVVLAANAGSRWEQRLRTE